MTEESPLARKLGITPGCSICLLDAPAPSAALLREACPPGVALTEDESGDHQERQVRQVRYDLIFLWPRHLDGLTAQFAALLTDLVDNKIAAFSEEEYGKRFVIRRERRPLYAAPEPADH